MGIFEESPYEEELIEAGIFGGEKVLKERWMEKIEEIIHQTTLQLPEWSEIIRCWEEEWVFIVNIFSLCWTK